MFRQVAPGVNPDVEVHLALHTVGCPHIATPLGWAESEDGVLAFLQEFLVGGTEGWESAQASVRDLFVEADLHPSDVGVDFAGEAERLGRVTAEVHASLRAALPTSVLEPEQVAARVAAHAVRPRRRRARGAGAAAVRTRACERAYDDMLALARGGQKVDVQRVHGDFHLGQTLRTPSGLEDPRLRGRAGPARRRAPRAGHPAARRRRHAALARLRRPPRAARPPRRHPARVPRGRVGRAQPRRVLHGYAAASGRDPRDDEVLLRALLTQKAVYEVVYEARMRPSWVVLPLAAVERLAA